MVCSSLLVVSGLMYGGGQRVVLDLMHAAELGCSGVEVLLLGGKPVEFESLESSVVRYRGNYNHVSAILNAARRVRRVFDEVGPLLVHTHGWDADVICFLARWGMPIRQVIHLHITPDWFGSPKIKHLIRRWITRRLLKGRGVRIVSVSEAVKWYWVLGLGIDPARIQVIRNGIDVNVYRGLEAGDGNVPPVIGVASRLAPMKGIEYLVDALGILAEEGISFRFKVAGTGSSRALLEARCAEKGIEDRCEFLGHVADMPSFYRSIDLFALPSISTEGLPLGVLEAMASGLPVVATTVAGTPEAIRDGIEGRLVPPRDAMALADALQGLLLDPATRRRMGTAGRARAVEAFSLERFSGEVFELYREMLEEPAS